MVNRRRPNAHAWTAQFHPNSTMRKHESSLEVDRMPFGKHRGTPLRSIPRDYLEWFLKNIEGCDDIKRSIAVVIAEWNWTRSSQPRPQRSKKKRKPPRERVNEVALGSRPEGWGDDGGAECPFDVPGEAELDAEYRAIVG